MTRIMFLLLAASLPSAIRAQNARPPLVPNASAQTTQRPQAQADSLEDDPVFNRLSPEGQAWVRAMTAQLDTAVAQKDLKALERLKLEVAQRELTGTKFCGEHVVGEGTMVDAYARSQSQDAFAVRWLDREPGMAVHTAIFTSGGRCVVKDGDMLEEGKSIVAVMPNSLAVSSQHGLVAYEAEYWNAPLERFGGGAPHRGLFIENKWVVDLDPQKASVPFSLNVNEDEGDFRWSDEKERIEMRPGVVLTPAAQAPAAAGANPANPPPASAPPQQPSPSSTQSGCVDTKQPAKKLNLGGFSLPGSLGKVLQKAQNPCVASPGSGQGGKR